MSFLHMTVIHSFLINSTTHSLWGMWRQSLAECEGFYQKQYKEEGMDEGGWMRWWSSVNGVFWDLWTNPSFNIQYKYHHPHPIFCDGFEPPPKCVESHSLKWIDVITKDRTEMGKYGMWNGRFGDWLLFVCVIDEYSIVSLVFWQIHILWICEWVFIRMERMCVRDWMMMME